MIFFFGASYSFPNAYSFVQVGGWTQVYGDILVFVLVRGGGHQTPATQLERSLLVLKAFLEGKLLPDS